MPFLPATAQPRCIVSSYYDTGENEPFNHIQGILQDKNGMIWITSWGGLFYFDGKDFSSSTVSSPEPEEVSAGIYSPPYGERWQYADDVKDVVVTDRFGVKWHIKSSGKIFTISPDGREVEYTERPEFKGYRGCFIDRQSNVWILCYNELHKLVFSSYRTNYLTETIGESVRCMYISLIHI